MGRYRWRLLQALILSSQQGHERDVRPDTLRLAPGQGYRVGGRVRLQGGGDAEPAPPAPPVDPADWQRPSWARPVTAAELEQPGRDTIQDPLGNLTTDPTGLVGQAKGIAYLPAAMQEHWDRLKQLETSGAPPEQIAEARRDYPAGDLLFGAATHMALKGVPEVSMPSGAPPIGEFLSSESGAARVRGGPRGPRMPPVEEPEPVASAPPAGMGHNRPPEATPSEGMAPTFSATVYHGSPNTDLSHVSANPETRQFDNATSQFGAFFSPTRKGAQRYVGEIGRIYETGLALHHPYEMPWKEFNYFQSPNRSIRDNDGFQSAVPPEQWGSRNTELMEEAKGLRQSLEEKGHDGIIIRNPSGQILEIASFRDIPFAMPEPAPTAEYPIAPRGEWYGDANYQDTGGRMVKMTPDEFLEQARPLDVDEISRDNIEDLKHHIQSGRTLDPLSLYDNGKEDGRHRAIAAKELGIKTVPVITWRRSKIAQGGAIPRAPLPPPGVFWRGGAIIPQAIPHRFH